MSVYLPYFLHKARERIGKWHHFLPTKIHHQSDPVVRFPMPVAGLPGTVPPPPEEDLDEAFWIG